MEEKLIRLNKKISSAGYCSRREADRLIEQGRVTVDGTVAVPGMKVTPSQLICLDGKPLISEQKERIVAVHKPRGVVCTTDRRWGDVLLEDLVPVPERLFYMGRLDKDSEGLILMTNQGDLADAVMRARNAHEKEYIVWTEKPVSAGFLEKMEKGILLDGEKYATRPCRAWKTGERQFHIVLTQGMNRQIRRMCESFGNSVVRLKRIRIMHIRLGELEPGAYRELTQQEKEQLQSVREEKK